MNKTDISVLVIQQKMIGDVLISTLICKNLKLWKPEIKIDFVANRHTLDVIQNNPYIDEILVFEDHFKKDKWGLFKFLVGLRKKKYDYIIDAYGKLESLLICFFVSANYKIGFKKNYSSFIYNQTVKFKTVMENGIQLSIRNRFQLLEPIISDFPKNSEVEIHLTPKEIKSSRKLLDSALGKGKNAIIVSALGSSKNKTYPLKYMAHLMDIAFQTTQLPFILNYRPNQEGQIEELISLLKLTTQKAVIKSLTPNSLRDYIATAYHCIAVVGNEGGAINIAKGFKKPTFAIFSPFIDPSGWHSETRNTCVAVNIKQFYPQAIDYSQHKKISKDPSKVEELYKMLKPELFKKRWINFLSKLVSD